MGQMRLEILNFLTLKSDFADEANPRNFKHENSIRDGEDMGIELFLYNQTAYESVLRCGGMGEGRKPAAAGV